MDNTTFVQVYQEFKNPHDLRKQARVRLMKLYLKFKELMNDNNTASKDEYIKFKNIMLEQTTQIDKDLEEQDQIVEMMKLYNFQNLNDYFKRPEEEKTLNDYVIFVELQNLGIYDDDEFERVPIDDLIANHKFHHFYTKFDMIKDHLVKQKLFKDDFDIPQENKTIILNHIVKGLDKMLQKSVEIKQSKMKHQFKKGDPKVNRKVHLNKEDLLFGIKLSEIDFEFEPELMKSNKIIPKKPKNKSNGIETPQQNNS